MNTKLLKTAFLTLLVLGILYFVREKFYFSWTIWWYDPILHFLAGGLIGISVLIIGQTFFSAGPISLGKIIFKAIISALVIGIIWELYELRIGDTSLSDGWVYVADTASDLIMDICGGFFGVLYGLKLKN